MDDVDPFKFKLDYFAPIFLTAGALFFVISINQPTVILRTIALSGGAICLMIGLAIVVNIMPKGDF